MSDITLTSSNIRKDTDVITLNGVTMFGLFRLPAEFDVDAVTADPLTLYDTLAESESAFMDIAAVRNYGTGSESLWWVLAATAGVIDVDRDAVAGLTIPVPSFDRLDAFRTRPPLGG